MTQQHDERMDAVLERLRARPGVAEQLPPVEGALVRGALAGRSVYALAQEQQMSEGAVWNVLRSAAGLAANPPASATGGMGSDTDPGVSGGYGQTGFGSLAPEPPEIPD